MKRRCLIFGHRGIILNLSVGMQCARCGLRAKHDGIMWRWPS